MKFKELLLREEIVSRTLGPLFCLGSGRSFRGHWTLVLWYTGRRFCGILNAGLEYIGPHF
jgi:hypothetical protein